MFNNYFSLKFYVERLDRDVEIFIASNTDLQEEHPLVLMQDGQNLFEDALAAYGRSWRLLDHLKQDSFPKVHIVGISNNSVGYGRVNEYSPFKCSDDFAKITGYGNDLGGKGDVYLSWIFETLLVDLKKIIRFKDVYVGGSSMGGYISLAAALSYPKEISGIFCLSNAWWFNYPKMVERIKHFEGTLPKLYLDTGTHESTQSVMRNAYLEMHESIVLELKRKTSKKLTSRVIDQGIHNESDWDKRFEEVILEILKD